MIMMVQLWHWAVVRQVQGRYRQKIGAALAPRDGKHMDPMSALAPDSYISKSTWISKYSRAASPSGLFWIGIMVHVWIAQTIGLKELCNNIHESEYQNGVKLLNHFWVVCFWRGHRNLWTLTLFYFFSSSAWNCFYLPPTRLTLFVMCRTFPCTKHWALSTEHCNSWVPGCNLTS